MNIGIFAVDTEGDGRLFDITEALDRTFLPQLAAAILEALDTPTDAETLKFVKCFNARSAGEPVPYFVTTVRENGEYFRLRSELMKVDFPEGVKGIYLVWWTPAGGGTYDSNGKYTMPPVLRAHVFIHTVDDEGRLWMEPVTFDGPIHESKPNVPAGKTLH